MSTPTRSHDRILTTHVGSLPRPESLLERFQRDDGTADALDGAIPGSLDAETVVRELVGGETAAALATDPASFDEDVSQLLISVA